MKEPSRIGESIWNHVSDNRLTGPQEELYENFIAALFVIDQLKINHISVKRKLDKQSMKFIQWNTIQ